MAKTPKHVLTKILSFYLLKKIFIIIILFYLVLIKVILLLNYPFHLCSNYDVIESRDAIPKCPEMVDRCSESICYLRLGTHTVKTQNNINRLRKFML